MDSETKAEIIVVAFVIIMISSIILNVLQYKDNAKLVEKYENTQPYAVNVKLGPNTHELIDDVFWHVVRDGNLRLMSQSKGHIKFQVDLYEVEYEVIAKPIVTRSQGEDIED